MADQMNCRVDRQSGKNNRPGQVPVSQNCTTLLSILSDVLHCASSKLNIIEQEFKYAEKTEFWRMKEEEEMRRTIQVT
jgi:hypothetical protein